MMWDMGDMEAELQTQHQANHWDAPMQEQTNNTTWLTRIRRQAAELECRLLQIDNCDNCFKIFNFFNVRLWQQKDSLQTQMRIICMNLLLLTCPNAFVWIAQQLLVYSNLTSLFFSDAFPLAASIGWWLTHAIPAEIATETHATYLSDISDKWLKFSSDIYNACATGTWMRRVCLWQRCQDGPFIIGTLSRLHLIPHLLPPVRVELRRHTVNIKRQSLREIIIWTLLDIWRHLWLFRLNLSLLHDISLIQVIEFIVFPDTCFLAFQRRLFSCWLRHMHICLRFPLEVRMNANDFVRTTQTHAHCPWAILSDLMLQHTRQTTNYNKQRLKSAHQFIMSSGDNQISILPYNY